MNRLSLAFGVAMAIPVLFHTSLLAQTAPEKSPAATKSKAVDLLGLGDVAQLVADFRQASETVDRLLGTLNEITQTIANAAVRTSKHHAAMSDNFDPFGFKEAFRTIDKQNQTIMLQNQMMQKRLDAEIQSLRKELAALKATQLKAAQLKAMQLKATKKSEPAKEKRRKKHKDAAQPATD